jgi:tellurite resistance protein TehA-like permease
MFSNKFHKAIFCLILSALLSGIAYVLYQNNPGFAFVVFCFAAAIAGLFSVGFFVYGFYLKKTKQSDQYLYSETGTEYDYK